VQIALRNRHGKSARAGEADDRQYAGYDNGGNRRRNSESGIGDILGGIFGRP
jgi:hypothetical protein